MWTKRELLVVVSVAAVGDINAGVETKRPDLTTMPGGVDVSNVDVLHVTKALRAFTTIKKKGFLKHAAMHGRPTPLT